MNAFHIIVLIVVIIVLDKPLSKFCEKHKLWDIASLLFKWIVTMIVCTLIFTIVWKFVD